MMALMLLFILFKSVVVCCPCFIFVNDQAIKDSMYVLFREVVIVLACLLILDAAQYYNLLTFTTINITAASYCALMALFIWTVLGFSLAVYAQR